MAGIDYYSCDVCGNKVYYDATTEYNHPNFGDMKVICKECIKDYEIIIQYKRSE